MLDQDKHDFDEYGPVEGHLVGGEIGVLADQLLDEKHVERVGYHSRKDVEDRELRVVFLLDKLRRLLVHRLSLWLAMNDKVFT